MENKKLIKEDKSLCNDITKDLRDFLPALNELKSSYEALEIGGFTDEKFKELISTGTFEIAEKYIKKLNDELDNSKIQSSLIRKNMTAESKTFIHKLNDSLHRLKIVKPAIYVENRPKLSLKHISFDEVFLISDKDQEDILESHCRIYLENEDEIKVFEVVEKLESAFNEYLEIFNESGVPHVNKHYSASHVFRINDMGKLDIYPEGVKFLANYKRRAAEFKAL
jgi:signal transduction histidine kinase